MKKLNEFRNRLGAVLLVLSLIVGPTLGFAQLLQGTLVSVNESAKTVTLETTDPATGQAMQFKIAVPLDAEFRGVTALKDLKTGDRVIVDASAGEAPDVFVADSIEVVPK